MARDKFNSAKNIIVGASPLFISTKVGDAADLDPVGGAGKVAFGTGSYTDTLNTAFNTSPSTAKFRNVGYTNNGLQITYNPTYGSVTVDQLLDTAKLFKESMEVMLMTEMTEGTLENLLVVFGQPGGSTGISTITGTETLTTAEPTGPGDSGTPQVLGLAAGALLSAPVERQLVAVGPAPEYQVTSFTKQERVYYARRVLSVQQSQFSLARNTPTTFPVTFRLLPSGDAAYAGQEYGKIIDRVYA